MKEYEKIIVPKGTGYAEAVAVVDDPFSPDPLTDADRSKEEYVWHPENCIEDKYMLHNGKETTRYMWALPDMKIVEVETGNGRVPAVSMSVESFRTIRLSRWVPDYIVVDGVIKKNSFECSSSYIWGGNCNCIHHPPRRWTNMGRVSK